MNLEQIQARIRMYEEAIDHLDMSVHDNEEEEKQAKIVQAQIRELMKKFIKNNCPVS